MGWKPPTVRVTHLGQVSEGEMSVLGQRRLGRPFTSFLTLCGQFCPQEEKTMLIDKIAHSAVDDLELRRSAEDKACDMPNGPLHTPSGPGESDGRGLYRDFSVF